MKKIILTLSIVAVSVFAYNAASAQGNPPPPPVGGNAGGPPPPPPPSGVPLDGGVSLLLAAGAALGAKKVKSTFAE
jgi:hypothetical protein